MSRSRRPKCPCGRGCGVCGDAGEVRRAREREASKYDERLQQIAEDLGVVDVLVGGGK